MPFEPDYPRDTEFRKLMAHRADVDLTTVALEIARDERRELDFEAVFAWIAERAAEVGGRVARAKTDQAALEELAACLAGVHGIYGDEDAYERSESSYLNRVIETGRGIPISLSLLYMAVGRRAGLELRGVSAPLHFLARYEAPDGPLFVDAFNRGRILAWEECVDWIGRISKLPARQVEASLSPASPRVIVLRLLNNLKALYARREDWEAALTVQRRLSALQPGDYGERRDLGLIALRANRPGSAVEFLEACLRVCPQDERDLLELQLGQAKAQLHRWN